MVLFLLAPLVKRTITNVAAGTVSATSADAVNRISNYMQ